MRAWRACVVGLAVGCASDPIESHPAYAQVQQEVATIIAAVRTDSGPALLSNLHRLVAYDLFAVEQLCELASDSNPRLRSNALYVLSQIVDAAHPIRMAEINDVLHDGLADADAVVRFEAATGLAARGDWSVLPRLIDGLENPDSGIRFRCNEQLVVTTSRNFGYSTDAPEGDRQRVIEQWRRWYDAWQKTRA